LDSVWHKGLNCLTLSEQIDREVNSDLVTTDWLVCSEMPIAILWSRISNASGDDSRVVKNGCSGNGVIIYLFKDEETMLKVILLEVIDGIKHISMQAWLHTSQL